MVPVSLLLAALGGIVALHAVTIEEPFPGAPIFLYGCLITGLGVASYAGVL
jgi:hypothetical protein